jgi:hypothetical protein
MSEDIEAALTAAYMDEAPIKEAKRRGKKEREMRVRPDDGSKLRATGRTVQLNVNAKPDVKQAAVRAAHKAGISLTALVENALLAYIAQLGARS